MGEWGKGGGWRKPPQPSAEQIPGKDNVPTVCPGNYGQVMEQRGAEHERRLLNGKE